MNALCPCGSSLPFQDCCEPLITGRREAATCQALMRSRYVAFTMANIDYLMKSHHSSTRPVKERKQIKKWAESVQWMGLTVLNTKDGEASDQTGYVEFRALYLEKGNMQQIHENSFFKRENNRWVYVSGVHF
ncbi:MAG TPA: YchJ family metal-binding protein [Prolixibacteraceae bacterium]|nr:YchJ family metal-binding protein [Prolixibacteraceae bacterium]